MMMIDDNMKDINNFFDKSISESEIYNSSTKYHTSYYTKIIVQNYLEMFIFQNVEYNPKYNIMENVYAFWYR